MGVRVCARVHACVSAAGVAPLITIIVCDFFGGCGPVERPRRPDAPASSLRARACTELAAIGHFPGRFSLQVFASILTETSKWCATPVHTHTPTSRVSSAHAYVRTKSSHPDDQPVPHACMRTYTHASRASMSSRHTSRLQRSRWSGRVRQTRSKHPRVRPVAWRATAAWPSPSGAGFFGCAGEVGQSACMGWHAHEPARTLLRRLRALMLRIFAPSPKIKVRTFNQRFTRRKRVSNAMMSMPRGRC